MTKGELRRQRQAAHVARQAAKSLAVVATGRRRRGCTLREPRRPAPGSAAWAETRGDDLPSLDQPGDDFDMEY